MRRHAKHLPTVSALSLEGLILATYFNKRPISLSECASGLRSLTSRRKTFVACFLVPWRKHSETQAKMMGWLADEEVKVFKTSNAYQKSIPGWVSQQQRQDVKEDQPKLSSPVRMATQYIRYRLRLFDRTCADIWVTISLAEPSSDASRWDFSNLLYWRQWILHRHWGERDI